MKFSVEATRPLAEENEAYAEERMARMLARHIVKDVQYQNDKIRWSVRMKDDYPFWFNELTNQSTLNPMQIDALIESHLNHRYPSKVIIPCQYCGQAGAIEFPCVHCGAPVS